MHNYDYKINNSIKPYISNLKNLNILEFGVKEGRSTKIFLELCKTNFGKLYSIDKDDYSNLFNDKNWIFINSRDDNFDFIEEKIPQKLDIIYLDSLHEADHVEKIFYHYFKKLKIGGFFFIDDISWLPYFKNGSKDNFYCEINNKETFKRLLEIYAENFEKFDISFDFTSSGMCKIKKKDENLNKPNNIIDRTFTLRNFLRKILKLFKNK